jgi:hypothetical protein
VTADDHISDVVTRVEITDPTIYDVSELEANPYPGPASYTYTTRAFYGGRQAPVRDAVQRLTSPGREAVLFVVVGASGSGKSSFVQAGLLPALEAAHQALGRELLWAVTRPGRDPIGALGRALTGCGIPDREGRGWTTRLRTPWALNRVLAERTPPNQVNVVVLDQFEEVFTIASPERRQSICDMLAGLGTFALLRTHVIVTLQADYLPALFNSPGLYARAKRDGIELRAMSRGELAEAIEQPLREQARLARKDRRLDPLLVNQLVTDVGVDPARLPLMQLALRTLWDEPPHRMVRDRYRGLTPALEHPAAEVRQHPDQTASDREQLMRILVQIVDVSWGDEPKHAVREQLIRELVDARQRLLTSAAEQRASSIELLDIYDLLLSTSKRLAADLAARDLAVPPAERMPRSTSAVSLAGQRWRMLRDWFRRQ